MKTNQGRILYEECPLCESKDFACLRSAKCTSHPLWHPVAGETIDWMQCDKCAHVFTSGYFTEAAAAQIFSKTNEHQKVGHDIERNRFVSARMVEKVSPLASEGDWLDIGFGNGSLLFTAHEYGFTPVGVDLRGENVAVLKSMGIEAYKTDFKNLLHDERYSVISMADVLEHMPFPKMALLEVRRLIRPSGVLFVSLPNIESYLWKALDANGTNPYWGEIEHYHNFGRLRLYVLLIECGFKPVRFGISERYRACMEVVALTR